MTLTAKCCFRLVGTSTRVKLLTSFRRHPAMCVCIEARSRRDETRQATSVLVQMSRLSQRLHVRLRYCSKIMWTLFSYCIHSRILTCTCLGRITTEGLTGGVSDDGSCLAPAHCGLFPTSFELMSSSISKIQLSSCRRDACFCAGSSASDFQCM